MWRQLGSWGVGGTTARNGPLVFPPTGAPVLPASNPTLPSYSSSIYGAGAVPSYVPSQPNWVGRNASWLVPVITTLLGGWLQSRSQKNANQANLKNAREQRNWDYMMWEKMNEYNSPANQRARYEAAGMSPWEVSQKGSPGNAGSFPTGRAPTFEAELKNLDLTGVMGVLDFYQNYRLKEEEIKSIRVGSQLTGIKQDTETINQLAGRARAEYYQKLISGYDTRTRNVELENQLKEGLMKYSFEYANQRNINLSNEARIQLQRLDIMNLTERELKYELEKILPFKPYAADMANQMMETLLRIRKLQVSKMPFEMPEESDIMSTIEGLVKGILGQKVPNVKNQFNY